MAHVLESKVAIVTGAARGIGRGIARRLAEADAHVVLADLERAPAGDASYELAGRELLDRTTAEVDAIGSGRALAIACDVTEAGQVEALIAKTRSELGGVDLVVNNAGIVHMTPIEEIDEARWDRLYAVNVKGPFLVSKAALPALAASGGSIVNIASVAGKRGYAGGTLYCSSKFAVVGFTQSLAVELAPRGVRVNAVCPGILPTHMWTHHLAAEERGGETAYAEAVRSYVPLGREQTAEDVGDAVLYLATAQNVTGISLNVAGGMEVW